MNRKGRRLLNKGDLDTRAQRIENSEKSIRENISNFDDLVLKKGKEFASMVIQKEMLPIIRDVLHSDLKASDEQIAIFETKFKDRFSKRLEGLGNKNEKIKNDTIKGNG